MNDDQQRFYRAIAAMEDEGDLEPLTPELEDNLVRSVLDGRAQQRARRQRWVAASAMAVAASFALFIGLRHPGDPLPAYQVYVAANDNFLGSAPPAPTAQASLTVDSVLKIELRPHNAVGDAAYVKSFLRENGSLQPLSLAFTRMPSGTFRVQQTVRAMPALHPGRLELIFAIGRSPAGPTAGQLERAVQHEQAVTADGWQVLYQSLEIAP